MMMGTTWLLILYLSSGQGISRIIQVESPIECIVRSQFEMRFDPRVTSTYCTLAVGGIET